MTEFEPTLPPVVADGSQIAAGAAEPAAERRAGDARPLAEAPPGRRAATTRPRRPSSSSSATPVTASSRANLSRIFDPFFTTRDVGEGHRPRPQHLLRHRSRSRRPDRRRERRRRAAPPSRCCCRRGSTRTRGARSSSRTRSRASATTSRRRSPAGAARSSPRRRAARRSHICRDRRSSARSSIAASSPPICQGWRRPRASAGAVPLVLDVDVGRRRGRRAVRARAGARRARAAFSTAGHSVGGPGGFEGVCMTAQRPSLVVVDDEQGILDVVSRFARRAGLRGRRLLGRARGDRAAADAARRPRDGRPADAGRRRARRASRDSRHRSALPGGADDRLCDRSTPRSKRSSSARWTI